MGDGALRIRIDKKGRVAFPPEFAGRLGKRAVFFAKRGQILVYPAAVVQAKITQFTRWETAEMTIVCMEGGGARVCIPKDIRQTLLATCKELEFSKQEDYFLLSPCV